MSGPHMNTLKEKNQERKKEWKKKSKKKAKIVYVGEKYPIKYSYFHVSMIIKRNGKKEI